MTKDHSQPILNPVVNTAFVFQVFPSPLSVSYTNVRACIHGGLNEYTQPLLACLLPKNLAAKHF